MGHEVFQRLIDFALGITAPEVELFTVGKKCAFDNGAAQLVHGACFVLAGLVLLVADDVLHGLGQLGDVALHHILANLHGALEGLVIGRLRQHHHCLAPLGLGHEPEIGLHRRIRRKRQEAQAHAAGENANCHAVNHLVKGEVVLPVAVLLRCVDVRKDHATDALHDGGGVHRRVFDFALDVLLLIGQEVVGVAGAGDVVLAHQAIQRGRNRSLCADFVHGDVVRHQDHDVFKVGWNVIHIAHQIQQLEHIHILRLYTQTIVRRLLAALDHPAYGAVQEGMDGVVEAEERHECGFVLLLNPLHRLLKARQHGALAAGQVLARIAVLANLGKHLLHDDELVGHKGEIHGKLGGAGVTLDVQYGIGEAEQVAQLGVPGIVERFQLRSSFRLLFQDALLNHLIHGGGGQAQAGLEARLNAGELVGAHLDDLVNGFLTGADHPHPALAFTAELLGQGLEVEQHVGVRAHILTDLVDHEQQAEIAGLFVNILLDVGNQLRDGELDGALVREPRLRIVLRHVQRLHEGGNDEFSVEGKGLADGSPFLPAAFLEGLPERPGLPLLVDVVLQHGDLEIVAVEAEVIVEHLGKDPQHGGLVLVDGAFNVNVEKDGLRAGAGSLVDQHEGRRVFLKLLAEALDRADALDFPVFEDVGQHLQEMGFTASKEAGDPDTHVRSRRVKGIAVEAEEGNEVLFQLIGDHVFADFLLDHLVAGLVDLDDAVDLAVDVVRKHIPNQHLSFLLKSH